MRTEPRWLGSQNENRTSLVLGDRCDVMIRPFYNTARRQWPTTRKRNNIYQDVESSFFFCYSSAVPPWFVQGKALPTTGNAALPKRGRRSTKHVPRQRRE
jgi:hypothetical protein